MAAKSELSTRSKSTDGLMNAHAGIETHSIRKFKWNTSHLINKHFILIKHWRKKPAAGREKGKPQQSN